jgi:putative nucleotidyltransferase with HDIG domain
MARSPFRSPRVHRCVAIKPRAARADEALMPARAVQPSIQAPSAVDGIAALGDLAQSPTVEKTVEAVRELLGMEVAYASEFAGDRAVVTHMAGDAPSFGLARGASMPLAHTYCRRILDGRLPNLIPDVRGDERAASLPITEAANVGSFASVPVRFSDGRLYGTLCAGSHAANPALGYRELRFLHVLARLFADVLEREGLERRARHLELEAATASALVTAVQARDSYTGDHSRAVVDAAAAVAGQLGLDERAIGDVKHVALLHDIGKIAVPDALLRKPGPLTDEEWVVMRAHTVHGAEMVAAVEGLRHLAPMVRAEHERWDGAGYPDGRAGDDIPMASRITLVCDAYHAMTSDRPYRPALSAEEARAEVERGLGTHFCPTAGRALLEVLAA